MPSEPPEPPRSRLTGSRALDALLPAGLVAIVLALFHRPPLWPFLFAAVGLVPAASLLGRATEELAARLGSVAAGLVQATLGNASELILGIVALRAGLVEVVKASLAGSIISNLLLILGMSMLFGGLRRQRQRIDRDLARTNAATLFLAAVGLVVPAVFALSIYGDLGANRPAVENMSLWTAGILILVYVAGLRYQFDSTAPARHRRATPAPGPRSGPLAAMAVTTAYIVVLSELLVRGLQSAQQAFHGTDLFWGGVVFAIIGNAAEHAVAVSAARRNDMDLAMAIGVGSSLQIALLLAPALVFISLVLGHPMSLVFTGIEVVAVVLSTILVGMIASDGETNWFEGAQLLAVYAILVVGFYFAPLLERVARTSR
jgi:Ca2+:H+ antiporter